MEKERTRPQKELAAVLALFFLLWVFAGANLAGFFTFEQDNWSGGATANTATHTLHQTGWTEYASKDAGVVAGANLTLQQSSGTVTHTTDGDFNAGTAMDVLVGSGAVSLNSSSSLTWTKLSPGGGTPEGREHHGAVWDTVFDRMLVFGGLKNSYTNELWSYDPATNNWTQLSPGGGTPIARTALDFVWDVNNSRALMFGGFNGCCGMYNDLWSYDPVTNNWTDLSPGGGVIAARDASAAVWNSAEAKLMIFGGHCGVFCYYDDLWEYDPASNNWTQYSPIGGPPTERSEHAMVWDGSNRQVLVFGGYRESWGTFKDFWSYDIDANTWTNLNPSGATFAVTRGHAMTIDGSTRALAFGSMMAGLWSYSLSGNAWTDITPAGGFSYNVWMHTLVRNELDGSFLFFGGANTSSGTRMNDLWRLADATVYTDFGNFTSAVIDLGQNSSLSQINWSATLPSGTNVTFRIRSGNGSDLNASTWYGPSGTSDYYHVSGTSINSVHAGHRYVQYRAFLNTTDTTVTPTLSEVNITYSYYSTEASLISSPFNTTDPFVVLENLTWNATTPANTSVVFQLRTAADSSGSPGAWSVWMGPDGTNATYFTNSSGNALPSNLTDGSADQWVQYRVFLRSANGVSTPSLHSVSLNYTSLDTTAPSVTVTAPASGAELTSATPTLTFTATDDLASTLSYVVFVDGSSTESGDGSAANGTAESVTLSSLADGSHTVTVQATDLSGNAQNGSTISFTIDTAEDTVTASSGSSTGPLLNRNPSKSQYWQTIAADEEVSFVIGDDEIAVEEISVAVSETVHSAQIAVEALEGNEVPTRPEGDAYAYLRLTKSSLPDESLSRPIEVHFRVEVDWLEGRNAESVRLLRLADGWEELPTEHLRSDSWYAYFTARTPGFSYFAIVADERAEEPPEEPVAMPSEPIVEPSEPRTENPQPVEPKAPVEPTNPWWFLLVLIPAAAAIVSIERKARRRKHRHAKP